MKKLWVFINSDGFLNTLKFVWKGVVSMAYCKSQTLCLYARKEDVSIGGRKAWGAYQCRIIRNIEELKGIDFGRLELLPCQKWLVNGSMVCVVFQEDIPVAFGWTHFGKHHIQYVGDFEMGNDIAWLGPSFVYKKYRGKGLQQLVLQQGVTNIPEAIKAFITSVNDSNYPSLHSFEKSGFKIGLKVVTQVGVFSSKYTNVKTIDKGSLDYLRIRK